MLSLTTGEPIAKIDGGKYKNSILKIDKNNENNDVFGDISEHIDTKLLKHKKYSNPNDMANMYAKILKDEETNLKRKASTHFKIYDGKLSPYPSNNKKEQQRDVLYIGGPSGSGKSYLTSIYLKNFRKVFPKHKIYLFSRVEDDEVLDKIPGLQRIMINDELLESPIDISELNKSCCIFDDVDTIPNTDLRKNIQQLRDDILECGRHNDIYCISTTHVLTNFGSTRVALSEATHIGFFPKSGSTYHIIRMLKVYCGLSQKQIKTVMALPSRWVMLCRKYPQYVLYDNGCYLLSDDN